MKQLLVRLKRPFINTTLMLAAWLSVFALSVVAKLIFGPASDDLMNYNPIFNGFIHGDASHLCVNLGLMFLTLIPNVNQGYLFPKIVYITILISFLYVPFSIIIGLPAVGISGTLYFFMTRVCLSQRRIELFILFAILLVPELIDLNNTHDGTAHIVHVLGSLLACLSLFGQRFKLMPPRLLAILLP